MMLRRLAGGKVRAEPPRYAVLPESRPSHCLASAPEHVAPGAPGWAFCPFLPRWPAPAAGDHVGWLACG
jgi:hypothetical protein